MDNTPSDPNMDNTPSDPTLRPPLGLPHGSIRALLALTIFGSLMTALILNHKLPESTFWYLWMVNYAVLGYYFASRQRHRSPSPHTQKPQPLHLPRGTVRWLIILSFLGTCGFFAYKWINGADSSIWDDRAFFPMLSLAGFFVGRLLNAFFQSRPNNTSKVFQHLREAKAILVLLASLIIIITIPFQVEIPVQKELQRTAFLFIFFYFGSRS